MGKGPVDGGYDALLDSLQNWRTYFSAAKGVPGYESSAANLVLDFGKKYFTKGPFLEISYPVISKWGHIKSLSF